MAYKPRSLFGIINSLNSELFLPHIQRPFVWDKDQMSKLFDSLMRGYPVQTLLFWRTKEEIKARKFMDIINPEVDLHTLYEPNKSQEGVEKVFVLDGQQRIQTLFCLYSGKIFDKITKAYLEAYIDITSSEINEQTNQIYNIDFFNTTSQQQLPKFRIRDLITKYEKKSSEDISDEVNTILDTILNDGPNERRNREKVVRRNISRLRSILTEENHFWVEEVDGIANDYPYNTILEIFVRVNSGGTKLDASDLMFAAMKELSASIEENLENIALLLSNGALNFEIEVILKSILLVNNRGATVNPKKFSGPEGKNLVELIDKEWDAKFVPAFQALRDFIAIDLKIDNPKLIRSYNSLVPIFEYFYYNNTPNPANKSRLKAFYYKSQIFNWFSSQTDGILDYLHNNFFKTCANRDFPMTDIINYFSTNRKYRSNFDISVLKEHPLRFFILHLLYVETNSISAFDVALKKNAPHIDHIYPKSKLSKSPFDLNLVEVNHIGNYRFVGATDNIRKRAENPQSYFGSLKNSGKDIKKHLLVDAYSNNPDLLVMKKSIYIDFRDKRTAEIFKILEPKINFI
jgi:uncharacterized protein with ParB-like and HNH nuclease domain